MRRRLAWWAARSGMADRLARGSYAVWERRADALTAWVRAGRREDLDGWRAALGPLVRLILLGVLAYAVWVIVRAGHPVADVAARRVVDPCRLEGLPRLPRRGR
ncbi:hypothetical protein ACF1G5_42500 [Streptomyces coeruleorubidus]|uniref:hypothetical protein n=1 Tax=Streptomyces coeruleorubidus TaxID=116188 RepID=UPI00370059D0